MPAAPDLKPALTFLAALRQHNTKPWFEQHRADYAAARGAFEALIADLIDVFREADRLHDLAAKDCIARIYRDVRFSKDKSPYKLNLGAVIAPGGWNAAAFGYYISLQPGGESIVAGGLHSPTPAHLDRFRRAIDQAPAAFQQVTRAKAFKAAFGAVSGERLKTAPRGYDPAHPEIDLLRLKQVIAIRRFSDQQVLARDFAGQAAATCRAMRPFLDYLQAVLQ